MIVVLDGTRDAPGACAWRPPSSSAGPAGQAAAVAPGLSVPTRATEGIYFGGAAGSRGARDLGGYPERRVGRVAPPRRPTLHASRAPRDMNRTGRRSATSL